MYWILMVMGLVVAIAAALLVGGLVTPRDHVASRSAVIPAPHDAVYEAVRDVLRYPEWRGDMIEVELVDPNEPGLRWREITAGGSTAFGMELDEPPHRFAARILDDDLPWGGTWTWEFAPEGSGTRVTITENGFVKNPMVRFIATHFMGFTKSMDRYLGDLTRHLSR